MNVGMILKVKGRSVATVRPQAALSDAATTLASRRIGAVVVVGDNGKVVGIVSERDVVRLLAEKGTAAMSMPVEAAMTRNVVTCTECNTIEELMETMTSGRFRHVPVVEDGALVGIVSIGDVVKYHIADMSLEVTAMRSYLATG